MFNRIIILAVLLAAPAFVNAKTVPMASRWVGSVRGCLGNSTVAEWNQYGSKLPRLCTCLANYLVKTCANSDSTSQKEFASCASTKMSGLIKAITPCVNSGREPHKNPFL